MPELPEVEIVARTLRPRLVGRSVTAVETSGKKLRRPIDRAQLRRACLGARVEEVSRIGKYLTIGLSTGWTLLAHLGMTGRFLVVGAQAPRAPHTHAVFALDDGRELRFVDHRRFGVLRAYRADGLAASAELSILGPDPLEPDFTVEYLACELSSARRDLKSFLLDQTRIAGLGNIYVCEALHLAELPPRRRTHRVTPKAAARLHAAIQATLRAGIENRGTSFSDYVDADGLAGENQNTLHVYGREGEPCRRCGTLIRRLVQGARSTFYCPRCQR
jgi:formamidopyrimidine-DNA glycosylase